MKIFLVGGLGFIGKRFIRKNSRKDDLIIYASNRSFEQSKTKIDLFGIKIEIGLVEDDKLIELIGKHKPDVVIHLAALTGLSKCHSNPLEAFKVNVYGTYNVARACAFTKSKLIFISSREVYGETKGLRTNENDSLIPNNVYGITKMIGENIVKIMSNNNEFDFTILRLTNVYGPEGDQYGAQVIIKDAMYKKNVSVLGGTQKLNYVFVDDVISTIERVLENTKSTNQIFNVGSEDTITVKEFVDKVLEQIEEKVDLQYKPMRETETKNFVPNIEKLRDILDYYPKTPLNVGITQTINWYKTTN